MACITLASYSILLNGNPQTEFCPSMGLRQSDHLSPYLFITYAKALSSLLFQAELNGSITSVLIGKGPLRTNYLFFVNDNLLFCKANIVEWCKISQILGIYKQAFG